jgi:hypothetical protein
MKPWPGGENREGDTDEVLTFFFAAISLTSVGGKKEITRLAGARSLEKTLPLDKGLYATYINNENGFHYL